MADDIGDIKAKVSIVDLAESSGIKLRKSGKSFLGLCPFHPDKNPSLHLNPVFGTFRCYSCGAKGDIIQWVMQLNNVDFKDALQMLADRAGITLSGRSESRSRSRRDQEAMDFATDYFIRQLAQSDAAKKYCDGRGITASMIERWGIGWSPDQGEALTVAMKKAGFTLRQAAELCLLEGDEGQGYRDRFRGRLMFPIKNERGLVCAFGGRAIGDSPAKYINSSDTPLFHKGKTLYGLFESQGALRNSPKAILVEGYLDVIACHEAGVGAAMASLGTSLTDEQAKLLGRWAEQAVVAYDSDEPGMNAAEKAASVLEAAGLAVLVAPLPKGDDPFSLLKSRGPDSLAEALAEVKEPLTFAIDRVFEKGDPADARTWHAVVKKLASSRSELAVVQEIDRTAGRYPGITSIGDGRKALRMLVTRQRKDMARHPARPAAASPQEVPEGADSAAPSEEAWELPAIPLPKTEEALIAAYLEGTFRKAIHGRIGDPGLLVHPDSQRFASALGSAFGDESPEGEPAVWLHQLGLGFDFLERIPLERYRASEAFVQDCFARLERERIARESNATFDEPESLQAVLARLRVLKSVDTRHQD